MYFISESDCCVSDQRKTRIRSLRISVVCARPMGARPALFPLYLRLVGRRSGPARRDVDGAYWSKTRREAGRFM